MKPTQVLALFLLFGLVNAQITFTGDAYYDFVTSSTPEAKGTLLSVNNTNSLTPSTSMSSRGIQYSGWDLKAIYLQYDYETDELYVGLDCFGICGDADGDGDPSSSTDPQAKDLPNFGGPETIAFMLWPDVPTDYVPNEWWNFYPTVIVGVDSLHDISRFGAYNFNLDCTGMDATECNYTIYNRVQNPGPYFASNYTKTNPSVRQPVLYTTPSVSAPDMEFTVLDFSKYYRVPFVPGVEPVYFSFGAYMGSSVDSVGEEKQLPSVYSIPCAVRDECGVCGGSNQDKDACGICHGDNSTCLDCLGVPKGGHVYDLCGVCGGNSDTCGDCAGTPNGKKVYDRCGVCGGKSDTCECFFYSDLVWEAEDTWIEIGHRSLNHGDDDSLWVAWNRTRSLVQFNGVRYDILQDSDGNPILLSATLRLFIRRAECEWTDPDLAIHSLSRTFEEDEATWECSEYDDYGACRQWRQLGLPPAVLPDYEKEPSGVAQIHQGQLNWLEFDILSDVIEFMNKPYDLTLGYLVKKVCEHGPGCISFWSCEGGRCPELKIRMRTDCPPVPEEPEEPPCPNDAETNWNWDAPKEVEDFARKRNWGL